MNLKQRIRQLAFGTLALTIAINCLTLQMMANAAPTAPSTAPSLLGLVFWVLLWAAIYMTLRPLLPNDAPQISN